MTILADVIECVIACGSSLGLSINTITLNIYALSEISDVLCIVNCMLICFSI